jgi:hypothetical protein
MKKNEGKRAIYFEFFDLNGQSNPLAFPEIREHLTSYGRLVPLARLSTLPKRDYAIIIASLQEHHLAALVKLERVLEGGLDPHRVLYLSKAEAVENRSRTALIDRGITEIVYRQNNRALRAIDSFFVKKRKNS